MTCIIEKDEGIIQVSRSGFGVDNLNQRREKVKQIGIVGRELPGTSE